MTGRKPRCVLSFSRRVLIIAAGRLDTPWQQLPQLLAGFQAAELDSETEIGHVEGVRRQG